MSEVLVCGGALCGCFLVDPCLFDLIIVCGEAPYDL